MAPKTKIMLVVTVAQEEELVVTPAAWPQVLAHRDKEMPEHKVKEAEAVVEVVAQVQPQLHETVVPA